MRSGLLIALGVSLFSFTLDSIAARLARVDVEEAEVYEDPNASSDVVGTIQKGTPLAASNIPTAGFYKVRLPSGRIGWITAEAIVLQKAPDVLEVQASKEDQGDPVRKSQFRLEKRARIKVLGGGDFFRLSDAAAVTGFDDTNPGYYFGGEFHFPISSSLAMGLRLEQIRKTSTARNSTDGQVFQFDVSSTPIMGGLILERQIERNFTFMLGAMGGVAFNTRLISTAVSKEEPNETVLQSSGIAALAKAELNWYLSQSLGIFAEAGYRYLTTDAVSPTQTGNGDEIFKISGSFVPIALDLSGFTLGGGATFRF